MEAVDILFGGNRTTDNLLTLLPPMHSKVLGSSNGFSAPNVFLEFTSSANEFRIVMRDDKKWNTKIYIEDNTSLVKSDKPAPLTITTDVTKAAVMVYITNSKFPDKLTIKAIFSSNRKYIITTKGWESSSKINLFVKESYALNSTAKMPKFTQWDFKPRVVPSGTYLIERKYPSILNGKVDLFRSDGVFTTDYDPKNLDMNLLWEWDEKNKTLSSYRDKKFSFSRVMLGDGMKPYVIDCDPLAERDNENENKCVVEQGTPGKYVMYRSYLADYKTGLCYSGFKQLVNPFLADGGSISGRIDINTSMVDVALRQKRELVDFSKVTVEPEITIRDYCSMNDEFGNPRVLTEKRCSVWYDEKSEDTKNTINKIFCDMNPKHPSCACVNYQETKLGKSLIKGLGMSPALGSVQCMLPQCTISSKNYLGKKNTKDCPSNVTLCSSIINQSNEKGNNLIDNVSLVQICGQELKTCNLDSDCKNNETCFKKDDKGYCIVNKPADVPSSEEGSSEDTPPEETPDTPPTPSTECKYAEKVYSDCVNGKRTMTKKVISGSCTDISTQENCNTCLVDKDCIPTQSCSNGQCVDKCKYAEPTFSACISGKRTRTDKSLVKGCEDIITSGITCVEPEKNDEKDEEEKDEKDEDDSITDSITEENKKVYILGGVILLIIVVLILYVFLTR